MVCKIIATQWFLNVFHQKTFKNHFVGSLRLGASTFWLPQPNPPNSKGDINYKSKLPVQKDEPYRPSHIMGMMNRGNYLEMT